MGMESQLNPRFDGSAEEPACIFEIQTIILLNWGRLEFGRTISRFLMREHAKLGTSFSCQQRLQSVKSIIQQLSFACIFRPFQALTN